MESDVRTHRIFSSNRRPLLISALLVALTSVPTMIVVAAGSASLDTAPAVRPLVVAEPRPGPLVLDPTPRSGLHSSTVPSIAAEPTAPLPPVTMAKPRATARSSGGSGGGGSVGTSTRTSRPVHVPSVPAPSVPAPSVPEAQAPHVVKPPPPPAATPIQNKAWPGWDGKLKGKRESIRSDRHHPSRTGSPDRSEVPDC